MNPELLIELRPHTRALPAESQPALVILPTRERAAQFTLEFLVRAAALRFGQEVLQIRDSFRQIARPHARASLREAHLKARGGFLRWRRGQRFTPRGVGGGPIPLRLERLCLG